MLSRFVRGQFTRCSGRGAIAGHQVRGNVERLVFCGAAIRLLHHRPRKGRGSPLLATDTSFQANTGVSKFYDTSSAEDIAAYMDADSRLKLPDAPLDPAAKALWIKESIESMHFLAAVKNTKAIDIVNILRLISELRLHGVQYSNLSNELQNHFYIAVLKTTKALEQTPTEFQSIASLVKSIYTMNLQSKLSELRQAELDQAIYQLMCKVMESDFSHVTLHDVKSISGNISSRSPDTVAGLCRMSLAAITNAAKQESLSKEEINDLSHIVRSLKYLGANYSSLAATTQFDLVSLVERNIVRMNSGQLMRIMDGFAFLGIPWTNLNSSFCDVVVNKLEQYGSENFAAVKMFGTIGLMKRPILPGDPLFLMFQSVIQQALSSRAEPEASSSVFANPVPTDRHFELSIPKQTDLILQTMAQMQLPWHRLQPQTRAVIMNNILQHPLPWKPAELCEIMRGFALVEAPIAYLLTMLEPVLLQALTPANGPWTYTHLSTLFQSFATMNGNWSILMSSPIRQLLLDTFSQSVTASSVLRIDSMDKVVTAARMTSGLRALGVKWKRDLSIPLTDDISTSNTLAEVLGGQVLDSLNYLTRMCQSQPSVYRSNATSLLVLFLRSIGEMEAVIYPWNMEQTDTTNSEVIVIVETLLKVLAVKRSDSESKVKTLQLSPQDLSRLLRSFSKLPGCSWAKLSLETTSILRDTLESYQGQTDLKATTLSMRAMATLGFDLTSPVGLTYAMELPSNLTAKTSIFLDMCKSLISRLEVLVQQGSLQQQTREDASNATDYNDVDSLLTPKACAQTLLSMLAALSKQQQHVLTHTQANAQPGSGVPSGKKQLPVPLTTYQFETLKELVVKAGRLTPHVVTPLPGTTQERNDLSSNFHKEVARQLQARLASQEGMTSQLIVRNEYCGIRLPTEDSSRKTHSSFSPVDIAVLEPGKRLIAVVEIDGSLHDNEIVRQMALSSKPASGLIVQDSNEVMSSLSRAEQYKTWLYRHMRTGVPFYRVPVTGNFENAVARKLAELISKDFKRSYNVNKNSSRSVKKDTATKDVAKKVDSGAAEVDESHREEVEESKMSSKRKWQL